MSTAQPPTMVFRDRSTRLMLLGIAQVLLGCLCLLIVALYFAGPMAQTPPRQAMNTESIQGIVIFALLALAFIWLGIGLVRARRWAWTLSVVMSWIFLVVGVVSFVMFMSLMGGSSTFASMREQRKMPPEAILIFLGAFLACILILPPGVFLAFCHRESVRATCQRRDPKIPWTDRCPMPVLALSIILGLSILWMSSLVTYRCVIPLFGVIISGAAGATVLLLTVLVLTYLAWGTYRLQMAAWWGTLLCGIVETLSMAVTYSRTDLMTMYEKMGLPADRLEAIRKLGTVEFMSHWGPWMSLVGGVAWLGYLLHVRRYFVCNREGTTATSPLRG